MGYNKLMICNQESFISLLRVLISSEGACVAPNHAWAFTLPKEFYLA